MESTRSEREINNVGDCGDENGVESTRSEREINNVGDCGDEYRRTFFEKPSGYRVRIRLFVWRVEQDLIDFRF